MMNKTQLFIKLGNDWVELDLSDNVPFPIILNIADVRDISKKNSSYSKTLTLPHTDNNSNVLNFIFDVANESSFNANKKVRAYVLNDTIQVFEGFFQLIKIKTDDNRKFSYECVIFGESDTLIKNIGEGFLTDLNFSELNHTYNKTNIEASWTKDWSSGYYYPLIDYNNRWTPQKLKLYGSGAFGDGPKVLDFKPAVYVKYIWDKIFQEAGFTYDSTFLNSDVFENLIIPFAGTSLKRAPQYDYLNTFRVNLQNTQSIYVTGSNPNAVSAFGDLKFATEFGIRSANQTFSRIKFNDDINPPYGDPSNLWSTTIYEFTNNNFPPSGKKQRFVIDIDITLRNWAYGQSYVIGGINFSEFFYAGIRVKRSTNPYTGFAEPGGFCVGLENLSPEFYFSSLAANNPIQRTYRLQGGNIAQTNDGTKNAFTDTTNLVSQSSGVNGSRRYAGRVSTVLLDGSSIDRTPLFNGEKLWVEVFYAFWTGPNNLAINQIKAYQTVYGLPPLQVNPGTQIFNTIEPDFSVGQPIDMSQIMPEKIKKKDFVTSIIKMFNLFIEPNKDNVNNLLIEPRDIYYSKGTIKDWSNKIDISKPIEQDLIAEAQNKKLLFTYKEDKDKMNVDYKTDWNQIYGQYEYEIDNDFITGEKKIDVIFSPTPMVDVGWLTNQLTRFVIPVIVPNDASTDVKNYGGVKILLRGTQSVPLNGDYWLFESTPKYSYPYAGHFDHPFNPTRDINWGQTETLYYSQGEAVNNNLFNNYYRKMIEELTDKDSRIVTAYFYLTPQDLYDLRFYDSIFVQSLASSTGNYFKINKIEYDPMRRDSYKVELLKANDIKIEITRTRKATTTRPPFSIPTRPIFDKDGLTIGGSNVNNGTGVISGVSNYVPIGVKADIFGNFNIVESNPIFSTTSPSTTFNNVAIFSGNNNLIKAGSTSSVIVGSDFSQIGLNTKNVVIVGGQNNIISDGVQNSVIVGGNGEVVRQSNTVKFGGVLISATNFVGAGRGEVLNRFPDDKIINYVSAGRGVVRELGTNSKENIISAGYGFII